MNQGARYRCADKLVDFLRQKSPSDSASFPVGIIAVQRESKPPPRDVHGWRALELADRFLRQSNGDDR